MNNQQPTIITFSVEDASGLFSSNYKKDINSKISIEAEAPITISNKYDLPKKHPFSLDLTQQMNKNQSEPLLLSPHSILNKSGQICSSPNVLLTVNNNERRPSLVKFDNDISSYTSNNTVFYDALTDQEKRKKSISTTLHTNNSRRPSLMSRISSAYTNKVSGIPFHEIDPFDQNLLQQGIVLCATVTSAQQEVRKRCLTWKKYRAVITQSGYLELYHLCIHQERNLLHNTLATSCFHDLLPYYKKPRFIIDLHPSIDNLLFQKNHLFHRRRHSTKEEILNDTYTLSLMSPNDFSWCLTSTRQKFYFLTDSVSASQQWYQSLYACLPSQSKKPLPTIIDLNIPELSICIKLPISELIQLEEENIDLKKVRDSALVLLHRNGYRPAHWNRRTTGLQWRHKHKSDWIVKPHLDLVEDQDDFTAFLIEARLIEKTHKLELHYYQEKEEIYSTKLPLEGYLRIIKGKSVLFYAQLLDNFLYLFETEQEPDQQRENCFKLLFSKKRNQTFPLKNISVLKEVIDLSQIEKISYDAIAETLHLDDNKYCFQSVDQPINYWITRLEEIMCNGSTGGEIKASIYIY
ncbi:hypothetical protein INT46_007240 [Mucor plumbeus]|uniref:PH domain-containing protein n=1 Tax=Mucor plumbeus TaxID=97098 RepID=A0A8H7QPR7_9FUNG|nr:hypothetical protein INT46_007240 [Mucor plumbeus]